MALASRGQGDPFEILAQELERAAQLCTRGVPCGADYFDADVPSLSPEMLRGSVIQAKAGTVFPGGGRYTLLRSWRSVRQSTSGAFVLSVRCGSAPCSCWQARLRRWKWTWAPKWKR